MSANCSISRRAEHLICSIVCRISKEKIAIKKATPTKTRRKLPKIAVNQTISSEDENEIDLAHKNTATKRTKAKSTITKASIKRAKVDSLSCDGVDGAAASKMGLKSSKSAKVKPSATDAHNAEPKSNIRAATGSSWTAEQLLSNLQNLDRSTSANIIRLFDEENTIPFICRYRRELTGNMDPDRCVGSHVFQCYIKRIKPCMNLDFITACVTLKSPTITSKIFNRALKPFSKIWPRRMC